MEKIIIKKNKAKARKAGYVGNEMWNAHRLEGVVKNKGIKKVKKNSKQVIKSTPQGKSNNPNKISKRLNIEDLYIL